MITSFDDYMIHQTAEPLAHPSTGERNFYDRYWFNGFDHQCEFIFEIGFGIYPNRHVMDGHFSVVIAGEQHAFHASRRAPLDRTQSIVGPLSIEILVPMRVIRVKLQPNETNISCDLTFYASSTATQEPRNTLFEGVRKIMDATRFTQAGRWEGVITIDGEEHQVNKTTTLGTRDKSWGFRPLGESEAGAPGLLTSDPGVYWVWAPIIFDNFITHYNTFQDREGNATQASAAIIPLYSCIEEIPQADDPGCREMLSSNHKIAWKKATRWPARAEINFCSKAGENFTLELQPLLQFQMLAIGYQHPEWGHGFWKGEQAIARESWQLAALAPLDYKNIHVHNVVRAKLTNSKGETELGIGTLETICFGRHTPSGFKEILDGAE